MKLLRVLLCLLHLAIPEEASKEGLCASGACDLPQAADEFAAIQVKKVAESQADPKKRVMDDTLLPNITTDLLQDGKDLQGNEGIPFKIWKIKKIKQALEGRRRHPTSTSTTTTSTSTSTTTTTTTATTTTTTTTSTTTTATTTTTSTTTTATTATTTTTTTTTSTTTTTTTTSTTTTTTTTTTSTTSTTTSCLLASVPDCPGGNFSFAFENLNNVQNGNSPGRVTGCISGLACGDRIGGRVATSVRVVSNTAGYGLGEYVGSFTENNIWSVSAACEIESFFFSNLGQDAPADGSIDLFSGLPGDDRCAALSTSSSVIETVCSCETKLTFKYNNPRNL